jgi:hypothetical protein
MDPVDIKAKIYSGCQKNIPIAERFFVTTLMPSSFFRNIIMTIGMNVFSPKGYRQYRATRARLIRLHLSP